MIPHFLPFGSYSFPILPTNFSSSQKITINPDRDNADSSRSIIASENKRIERFIHMDFNAKDDCWYYAVNRERGELHQDSPYEVFRINQQRLPMVNEPEFCGIVDLQGLICDERLWLDRSGNNFYGLCLHPDATTASSEGALNSIFYYDRISRSIGAEDGQICLMKIDRQTLQRVDLQISEPIEIGKFDGTGCLPGCRLYFHFLSDTEAILILDRCEFIGKYPPAGYFTLHSDVYRLFLGNQSQPIVVVNKIEFPDFLEETSEYDKNLVKESMQIYVYIEEKENDDEPQQNAHETTPKFFFYIVDLYQVCHVLDESNWKWIKWKSDWCMKPSTKHFMCRDRFDTGILLVNDVDKLYVKMQLIPSQKRCRFQRLFSTNTYPWTNRTASVYSGYAKPDMFNNRQLRIIWPPPLPLRYLAYWKLAAILEKQNSADDSSADHTKPMPTKTPNKSIIIELPTQELLISTCKQTATLMRRNLI